jgi:hypothetical protein
MRLERERQRRQRRESSVTAVEHVERGLTVPTLATRAQPQILGVQRIRIAFVDELGHPVLVSVTSQFTLLSSEEA